MVPDWDLFWCLPDVLSESVMSGNSLTFAVHMEGRHFILIYLLFLIILGIPVLVCEFAVGRGSRKSVALSFDELQSKNGKWTPLKFIGIIGCYMLMMFYTTVGGWLMYYCYKGIRGSL